MPPLTCLQVLAFKNNISKNMFYATLKICTGTFKTHRKRVLFDSCNTNLKENPELAHNKDCFLSQKNPEIFSVFTCHLFAFILLDAVKGEK